MTPKITLPRRYGRYARSPHPLMRNEFYLKWVAGVALCAIPTLDTPRAKALLMQKINFEL